MRSRAAERRQIHSLGREPQDTNEKILRKPRSGDRNIAVIPAAHGTDRCLSPPPGASCLFVVLTLGLTPQAKNMPRLRRSNQGVTPEGLHGGSTSGANLFQDETSGGSCILYLRGLENLLARREIKHRKVAVELLGFARSGVRRKHETRVAGAGPTPVAEATIGMDRHHSHPIARICEPTVAAEGVEVIHL